MPNATNKQVLRAGGYEALPIAGDMIMVDRPQGMLRMPGERRKSDVLTLSEREG